MTVFDAHLCQVARHHGGLIGGCVILVQVPLARFEEFWPLAAKFLPELPQNLHIVFLVDHQAVGDPVDVDDVFAVKERDHHELPSGPALSGLLGSGRVSVLPLGTLSLGLWMVTIHPAFVTGQQRVNDTRIRGNELNHLLAVTNTPLLLFVTEQSGNKLFTGHCDKPRVTCGVHVDTLAVSCNVDEQNWTRAFMTTVVRIYENDSYLALLIGLLRGQSQNFWSGPLGTNL